MRSGSCSPCPLLKSSSLLLSPLNSNIGASGAASFTFAFSTDEVGLGAGLRERDEAADLLLGSEGELRSVLEFLCVRSCCFMLSFRVKALLQVGQWMFFSPVCFFPWRAAWPDVVNVSWHKYRAACGQGYFFFAAFEVADVGVVAVSLSAFVVGVVVDAGETTEGGKAACGDNVSAGSVFGYCPCVLIGSRLGGLRRTC